MNDVKSNDRFDYAVSVILKHEGGLSTDHDDSGGVTNFGITVQFLKDNNFALPSFINSILTYSEDEKYEHFIRIMTEDEAKEIYQKYIWDKYHLNLISDIYLVTKVFDMIVNMGPHEAIILLQNSINQLNKIPIKVDGILGIVTLHTVNSLSQSQLMDELCNKSAQFYQEVAAKNPKDEKFLKGWLTRAASKGT